MTAQPTRSKPLPIAEKGSAENHNQVKKIIAVMSGKGGVGKSFTTGLLASGLARSGLKIGVLDADITGPSIPMLFGLHGKVTAGDVGILPLESRTGIKVMSMNLLLDTEDQPVIWRGPLVSRAIQQLWGDVMWGDLDVLLIDLPPGTSDATLTIMQSLPVDGLVMVTTPQSLASMVVRKAVHMAQIMDVKIIGIIENMAYFRCPDVGKKHFIFGQSHSQQVAEAAGAPILARIPIHPEISDVCDMGNVEAIDFDSLNSLLDAFARAVGLPPIKGREPVVDESPSQEGAGEDLGAFSPPAQQVILARENLSRLENPDLRGKVRGCCGDSMQVELTLDGESIQDARYMTDGCLATMACGGMLTRMVKGQTLQAALNFTAEDLLDALGGLPTGYTHCASLAVKTLQETIRGSRLADPLEVNPEDLPIMTQ